MHEPNNLQIKMAALLQSAAGRPKRKRILSLNALLEVVDIEQVHGSFKLYLVACNVLKV